MRDKEGEGMTPCLMAGCFVKGTANYLCALCGERKIFCCEGCELQLLNDLRAIGKVEVVCTSHHPTAQIDERVKGIKVPELLKKCEAFREKLVTDQKFEESVILRDLGILVRCHLPGKK